jgi:hypothetical protein
MNSSGTPIHPPGRVTVGLSMVCCSPFIIRLIERLTYCQVFGPISAYWGIFRWTHNLICHQRSCDTTFEENCDPERAYTDIGSVRLSLRER